MALLFVSISNTVDGFDLLNYLFSVVWDLIGLDTPALNDFLILFYISVAFAESSLEGITTIVKSIKDTLRIYFIYSLKVRLL